jgi:hypothetical protein
LQPRAPIDDADFFAVRPTLSNAAAASVSDPILGLPLGENPSSDVESKMKRDMQPFEYRLVGYWTKEINGKLIGGPKN